MAAFDYSMDYGPLDTARATAICSPDFLAMAGFPCFGCLVEVHKPLLHNGRKAAARRSKGKS